jgi:hypothetical protein
MELGYKGKEPATELFYETIPSKKPIKDLHESR